MTNINKLSEIQSKLLLSLINKYLYQSVQWSTFIKVMIMIKVTVKIWYANLNILEISVGQKLRDQFS